VGWLYSHGFLLQTSIADIYCRYAVMQLVRDVCIARMDCRHGMVAISSSWLLIIRITALTIRLKAGKDNELIHVTALVICLKT
jgi:hypothetical protein